MADCKINVMMFGGRRCGKTSVLTAMNRNFEDIFGCGDLAISQSDYETMDAIDKKQQEIDSFFLRPTFREFSTDGLPSVDDIEYNFNLQIKGREHQDRITFSFYDFPGEWLDPEDKRVGKEKHQILAGRMKTCGVIIIAIDTPYLMEPLFGGKDSKDEVGRWNDRRNCCKRIASMVKNYFTPSWGPEQKMILFVPLKCEKYYACGQMGIVNHKIQKAYKELLDYVNKGDNLGHYEVAIVPILTFGKNTVFFSRFQTDDDDNPVDEDGKPLPEGVPAVSLFQFENANAQYSPQFCEQPFLYALSYLFYQVERTKKSNLANLIWLRRFIQVMGETFGNWVSAEDFLEQRDKIQQHLKTRGDGYEILSDPLGLKLPVSPSLNRENKFTAFWQKMGRNHEKK